MTLSTINILNLAIAPKAEKYSPGFAHFYIPSCLLFDEIRTCSSWQIGPFPAALVIRVGNDLRQTLEEWTWRKSSWW